ncbi:hypothetical protein OH76DRAFT_854096 [Lentinus brumalis]|uniref:Uncharacterized protein n=1 Tax=Lentinus brumalis TaxID=2498619 RepID=A0A371DR10_9APHY|nr:hypothetical protein OH76DRAFT_854096 [Polyporus brumalis]
MNGPKLEQLGDTEEIHLIGMRLSYIHAVCTASAISHRRPLCKSAGVPKYSTRTVTQSFLLQVPRRSHPSGCRIITRSTLSKAMSQLTDLQKYMVEAAYRKHVFGTRLVESGMASHIDHPCCRRPRMPPQGYPLSEVQISHMSSRGVAESPRYKSTFAGLARLTCCAQREKGEGPCKV